MKKLILHPTEMGLWYDLVNEAEANTHLILSEATESYLVFLLMRFMQSTHLMESVLALDILEASQWLPRRQARVLKEVGDKSLLFCGLFPGMAQKKRVSLGYFSDLGQAAYLTLSEIEPAENHALYSQLSEQFSSLQCILQALRGVLVQDAQKEKAIPWHSN